jgi:hypothetical protein
MKILHLDSGREMRGGQWQVVRLMRGLRRLGHSQRLLAPPGSPLAKTCREEMFHVDPLTFGTLLQAKKDADVVHAHDARTHARAALAGARPLVVSRRVIFPVKRGLLSRWKYSRADLYLAVSQAVAAELRKAKIPEDRIHVVYDGVPLLDPTWELKGPVIVPAIDDPKKATALAIRAAESAKAPLLRSHNLTKALHGAGLLLYLTHSEGLGSAPLLAMSAGVPVIASDVGGLREIVDPGINGVLVENDEETIAETIRVLRSSPEQMRRMSQAASRTVRERFTEERMVRETVAAYESLHAS